MVNNFILLISSSYQQQRVQSNFSSAMFLPVRDNLISILSTMYCYLALNKKDYRRVKLSAQQEMEIPLNWNLYDSWFDLLTKCAALY